MANKLEFMQTNDDITEFLEYLYDNNCYLTVRSGTGRGTLLDKTSAIDAMCSDLFSAFGTYYIGQGDNREVLWLDSCGRQSHPRNLGNRGRLAGSVGCVNKNSDSGAELLGNIRRYFRKHYSFEKYNGNARMSCFFGPHYAELDSRYAATPEENWSSPGYLRITYRKDNTDDFEEILRGILLKTNVITIATICNSTYWLDSRFNEIRIEFFYDNRFFDFDSFAHLFAEIVGDASFAAYRNNHNYMSASNYLPLWMLQEHPEKCNVSLVMEHPWQPIKEF